MATWRRVYLHLTLCNCGPHKPITPTGQCYYPILSAGNLAESPAQCSNLHREVALLDGETRPRRLDECVLGDQRSTALDKRAKQRHRTFTERNGFGVPKKDLALQIETKRTESVNGRDGPVLLLLVT
jgi:hypothetical protein